MTGVNGAHAAVPGRGEAPARAPLGASGLPARAKINLALHILGRRADGYHRLDSLVAFTELGDELALEPAGEDGLAASGPFAALVPTGPDNLALQALAAARGLLARNGRDVGPMRVRLEKRLPIASGLGGGSADAAAVLAHFAALAPGLAPALREAGLALGADVPMCLDARPARVTGIGEVSRPVPAFPGIPIVLVNCDTPVSTPAVFGRLAARDNPPLPEPPPKGFASTGDLLNWLRPTRNDLSAPAEALAPSIAEARGLIEASGARLARMSGSGATVFGLFETDAAAGRAARDIAARRPGWWIAATRLAPHPEGFRR